MTRLIINIDALRHNVQVIDGWMNAHGASWSVVTKMLCGNRDVLRSLEILGVRSVGDSRLQNLATISELLPSAERWYLRLPHKSELDSLLQLADVSLNTELDVIRELDERAGKAGLRHRVVIMIELGDLREGILPGTLVEFYNKVLHLEHLDIIGIGANIGCLSGTVPSEDQLTQLVMYRELLELKFQRKLPVISVGSSVVLPLLLDKRIPRAINHWRIGESLFLGTDILGGGALPGLREDAFTLEAEILEIKKKGLTPFGEVHGSIAPFEFSQQEETAPGQRGWRAILSVGQLDTDVNGLSCCDEGIMIAGASSDVTVVNLGDTTGGLQVGDTLRFRPNYGSLVRLMNSPYIPTEVRPRIGDFREDVPKGGDVHIPPVFPDGSHPLEVEL
jgi:predicted amino acid racemase